MSSWLKDVIDASEEIESPKRFYYWAALTAISAVVRKSVWLNKFNYRLYPNIYTMFIAKSGLRKGTPVTFCRNLVEEIQCTRIVMGRVSMPFVLKALSKAYSTASGNIIADAHGLLVSGEFASFLVKDPDALTILTDIYDTHAYEREWVNSLKGTGVDTLKSPCLTLLAATNDAKFSTVVSAQDIEGGFIARTFIIHESTKRCISPLVRPPERILSVKDFVPYLTELSKLVGEFKWANNRVIEAYELWYLDFCSKRYDDTTGTMDRIHDGILKVAMLLSLAEDTSLEIRMNNLEEAIEEALKCAGGTKRAVLGQGGGTYANATKLVFLELIKCLDHTTTRKKLLAKYWGYVDGLDLDRVVETLVGAGVLTISRCGVNVIYTMKKETVEAYEHYKTEDN